MTKSKTTLISEYNLIKYFFFFKLQKKRRLEIVDTVVLKFFREKNELEILFQVIVCETGSGMLNQTLSFLRIHFLPLKALLIGTPNEEHFFKYPLRSSFVKLNAKGSFIFKYLWKFNVISFDGSSLAIYFFNITLKKMFTRQVNN